MNRGAFTRPNYEGDLKSFIEEYLAPVREAVRAKDAAAFETTFAEMVKMANEYHDGTGRDYIVWKLPDYPPPDLDFTPRT